MGTLHLALASYNCTRTTQTHDRRLDETRLDKVERIKM